MSIRNPTIGQRIMYSRQFLNSIKCGDGDMPNMRGTITKLGSIVGRGRQFVKVLWDDELEIMPDGERLSRGALSLNLSPADRPEL